MYRKLYELSGNTCSCPSLAYLLFYPELVINKVPSSLLVMSQSNAWFILCHIAPKIAYSFYNKKLLNFLINLGRIITFHPPLKRGQFHTLATMKELAKVIYLKK